MAKILIVEDDLSTIRFLEPELTHEGYSICTAMDGKTALRVFEREKPDLVLLDIMIPELNGIGVLKEIRKTSSTPVILVTARNETSDKVIGLETGADDYISKPFEIEELLARVKAVLRRANDNSEKHQSELKNGEIILYTKNMTASVNDNIIQLTKNEYLILKLFMENLGEVLSRNRIIDEVWGVEYMIDQNSIDVYLNYLRNKIKKYTKNEYFKNQRGVGYVMEKK